jgi:putative ATPase
MSDLFNMGTSPESPTEHRPLADRMRPEALAEVIGQDEVTGRGGLLREMVEAGRVPSLIFWGPPGCGKTTLANVLAKVTQNHYVAFSAVLGGVKEVRAIVAEAEKRLAREGRQTILFVDEIHRFNKSQQDAFLPHVEKGTVVLVGATTENPSFEVNAALLSRCTVVRLKPLAPDCLAELVKSAATSERGLAGTPALENEAATLIAGLADTDARRALNLLEQAAWVAGHRATPITPELVQEVFKKQPLRHDKGGDDHYDVLSAFIKTLRGSDPDAALYWMVRLLEAGEDPIFVLRRMVIFAAEDVGNADPRALEVATNALSAVRLIGLPEGRIPMAQAVVYLATAPKSNASYLALKAALEAVKQHGSKPVPMHLRNAPTRLMAEFGAGKGYQYPHDFPGGYVPENYWPEGLSGTTFYRPKEAGYEKHIQALMTWRKSLDDE